MTTVQLLAELGRRGVRLWAEGGALRFSAPRGALTEELRGEIAARRPEVLALLREGTGGSRAPAARVERAARGRELPLSFAQRRLWFLDRLEPGSTLYSLPFQARLRGELDGGALARSLAEVVRRHEVLRTVYRAAADGEPVQLPLPPGGWRMQAADLRALDPGHARTAAAERARAHAAAPFDLAEGPVFRALLLRVDAREHLLALNVHHVAFDEWSEGVLFGELGRLYSAFRRGEPAGLEEFPVQYADYALWQRERLRGEPLERELAYWRRALEGAPRVLELPSDRPRPPAESHRGAAVARRIERPLLDALLPLARGEGATLHMLLLAAFQALLSRHGGQDDVVVGTPIAGRTRAGTEPLIGFFVNTLALRADLSGAPSFRELLRRARETTLGAYAHQELPFERLVEELAPERSLGHHPLFQVMLVLQDRRELGLRLEGTEVETLEAESRTAKFDLTLTAAEDARGLRLALEYATDLFDAATAARMLEHLGVLLEGAAREPELPLAELPLLAAAERRLLEEWSRADRSEGAAEAATVHGLFAAQAARTPGATALVWGEERLTYAELDARAEGLARRLRARGVGPETVVGIFLERGPELVAGLLGILKAGGAYLPLDPSYPAERLAFMLRDSGAGVVLTREALRGEVPAGAAELLCLDAPDQAPTPRPGAAAEGEAGPENLAYLIYTSGSTGTPKGVAMPHRPLVNLLEWLRGAWDAPAAAATLQFATVGFDVAFQEIFSAWSTGGHVVLIPEETRYDPAALLRVVEEAGVERLFLPAVALQHVAELADARGIVPPSLREVQTAGEQVRLTAPLRRWLGALGVPLHNHYGPSETHVATAHALRGDPAAWPTLPPIGRPIANTRAFVLDAALRPAPVGVPGELYLGGECLARGYLGRPEWTAARFLPDPCSPEPGARVYRSGDRVRWLPDGTLEFLGRADEQAKIRGFRVEPGEVEAALEQHPGVREAVVVVREADGEKRLVAYHAGPGPAAPGELRAFLRERLPEYLVPSAFVALEALPLTPSGKVARRALPEPKWSGEAAYVAPRTPTEEILAGIWAEVLGLERVGVEASFFALGGHSLMATRLTSRVRAALGVELPVRAVFEHPTVAALAAHVRRSGAGGSPAPLPDIRPASQGARERSHPSAEPVERAGPPPLSFSQERLWFLDRMEPGSAVYNLPLAWRLGGGLAAGALERALGEIVRRHEVLRTTLAERDGAPVQVVAPFGGFALPVEDLSSLGEAEREAKVGRRAAEDAARPFDLAAGPLFRARLLRLGEREHVLLLCMHHVVGDGWSMGVLVRELSALYAAYRDGTESPLAELPVQYADFAAWQREQLRGEVLDRLLAYWRERLAGAPTLLELPTDHPRPTALSHRGAHEPVELDGALVERLSALARSEGATLYMVLLGAFQLLLAKYAGSEDVVVGSPIAGRTRRETEELIGFFVNTLVLRVGLGGDPSFREVLRRVRETTLGAYEHQDLPFERLVVELHPERSLGHSPLFQATLTLLDAAGAAVALPGIAADAVDVRETTAKFDLSLSLAPTARGMSGGLTYSTDLFERGTIVRMLGHLVHVLEQVAADADARLSGLELAGEAERRRVVEEWNRTEAEYPSDRCLHQLFEEQAGRTPAAVALRFEERALTFAALDEAANRLAHHLRRRGVGPDVPVALCMERCPELIVAVLAVLKAGGAYLPLDPAAPAERLAAMLADSGAPLLLTHAAVRERVPGGAPVLCLDEQAGAVARESARRPRCGATPGNLAYVVYTSGSTGRPKGVLVQHGGACNLVHAQARAFAAGPGERVLQFAPLHFDTAVAEIFISLASGAELRMGPREAMLPGDALAERMREWGITSAKFTPTALGAMPAAELPALKTIVVGGEECPAELVERWAPGRRFFNVYGPTEATVRASMAECVAGRRPTIGRALPNTRLYVLDAAAGPQPVGVPGELYVGGAGTARGYLGRPELTAERFVPDALGPEPGGRLYRTGDRVRWLPTGELEFLGRLDEQVKIRGFRVEPGEIEAALRRGAGVSECVVVAREDAPGEKRLAAYVVGAVEVEGLRERLRRTLPEYMVPAAIVTLDALPLTPSGKVDRRALPAPEYGAGQEGYAAPRTPAEEVLAGIWGEVLGRERVGVRDRFFDLGGHSLLATRVVSRVREVFGVELPLRALFEAPTVAELAGRVETLRSAAPARLPPVVPVERAGPLPLSFAQERLWFLNRLEPGSGAYNIPLAWRLAGALDVAALGRALGEIVRRHETLRTTFAEVDGAPVQKVAPFGGFVLPVEELAALGEPERAALVERRASAEAAQPFDLAAGPLFRARLLRLGSAEHLLLVTMHHVVGDGWSTGVLVRELSALYAAFREGRESPLPPLPVQYADFAVWQREQLRGEALERQLAYWRERLADAPALLELPTDRPRPAARSHRGAEEPVELEGELVERLRALGRSEGATPYMVLLGAFQLLLSRYAGSEDVVVGSPIAGRTRGEVEGLIGFFVNTLVLRADLSGDPSFRGVLRRVREATLGAYEHQELPFERLVEEMSPGRSLGHSPLFQALFALQNAGEGNLQLGGVEVEPLGTGEPPAKFDLSLVLHEHDGGIGGVLLYRAELWDAATVRRMLGHFRTVLDALAADPDRHLSALELVDAGERRLLVEGWSRSGEAIEPVDRCVHELFAEQAERTPDAVALAGGAGTLTYAELHRRSDHLARRLGARGVGPDVRVGICMERSPEMVVGLLGILKAGGAYVPLDPRYPAERLAYMLADARVPLLLTQDGLRDRFPEFGGEIVSLCDVAQDGDAVAAAGCSLFPVPCSLSLAYVIYTSGSTGRPKGTEVPHRAIPGFFRGAECARWDPGTVVLQHSSISWDALTLELWPALLTGGTCVLYPGHAPEPAVLGEQVREHGVNTLWLTAAYFNLVVDTCPEILAGVRQVMTGGETVSAPHVRRALELYPGLRLVNGYGPSETTVFATCFPVPAGFDAPALPVGRPVGDRRVYLLDRHLGVVPPGVVGEVCIGGPAVARGYLGQPGLTAERFVPDPFAGPRGGARLYRSGDRARWRPDGQLEFVGRTDFQAKVRGFRVEPGEVEAVLASHPGVREAAVTVHEAAPGDRRLAGYVTAAGGAALAAAELRAWLGERMPEHMVPAALAVLDAMPLTPHGKLDRRALPAPEYGAAEERYVAPRTPVEEVLAGIWAETMRLERVGAADDFFELGGHSLLATRVVSRVRETLGVELPLRALFEGPTVAELAGRVEALRRAELPTLPPVVPVERARALPLSFAQERLWFLDRLQPGSAQYNVPQALRLGGPLDRAALERALGEVVRRHEALRTTFAERGGAPVQAIAPFGGFVLPGEDLSRLGAGEREARVRRRAAEEAARPFDLAAGPLFRARLLRLGDREHVLLLCMHHIVSDGWSMGVLFRELSALYGAGREGRESPLAELPVQYADYAVWQREQLRGEALERELSYWKGHLAGAPELLELPTDRARPAAPTFRGAAEHARLRTEVLDGLRALGRREGATLYMVGLAAFQALLSRYGGSEDVVVGSPSAGRGRREVEGLIGFFVNTLVLRTDLSGDPSFRELVGRVRETTLGAYEHQEVPFERLVAELRPERSLSHSPLFQVVFTLDDAGSTWGGLPGLDVEEVGVQFDFAKFDLSLGLAASSRGLHCGLTYATDLWDAATMRRLLGHFVRLLEEAAAGPERRLSGLRMLGDDERGQLLHEWSSPPRPAPRRCVHELFAEQARRVPEAVAVASGSGALTYAELDRRSDAIARTLRERGVGPEAPVGVCVERTAEMVAAVLGVFKAGGVFVPLDPRYPVERLAFVLEDSGARLLLTDGAAGDGLAGFAGETLWLDRPEGEHDTTEAGSARPAALTPRPPLPMLGEGEHDDTEGQETLPQNRGRVASLSEPGGGDPGVAPEHLAYVIYTSGSTGTPKGVAVTHGALANTLLAAREAFGLEPDDEMPSLASFAFDIWLFEALLPLLAGASVRMVPRERVVDVDALVAELASATVLHAVPALMRQVVERVRATRGALPAVRWAFVGGDAVPPDLLGAMRGVFPAARVRVLYGPTEGAVICAAHPVGGGEAAGRHLLGRPLGNAPMYVLDRTGEPAPVGVPGELCIGGASVARGYLGRAQLTAERFVPDPFPDGVGARMYRTGDRARWGADGLLEFLGRIDAQVKVRGFRIEPGEVEARLAAQPGVREAAVVAREDAAGDRRLVAYVVAEDGAEVAPDALRRELRSRLPEHMVPSAVVVLERLPLTPNGKVDPRALPAPDASAGREYVAPRTALEEVLADAWAEVLELERVGVHDSFFDLGGHSLLATRVVARMRVLRVEVPVRQLFETPTVAGLAEAIVLREPKPGTAEAVAGVLLKLKAMSPEERSEARRAKQQV